jgi:hypothetical protein
MDFSVYGLFPDTVEGNGQQSEIFGTGNYKNATGHNFLMFRLAPMLHGRG